MSIRPQEQGAKGRNVRRKIWEPTPEQLAIYEDYIRGGLTTEQVGQKHKTSHQTVSRLVRRIDNWLIPQFRDRIRHLKAQHTSRLMHLHAELMQAWERSKKRKRTIGTLAVTKKNVLRFKPHTVEITGGDAKYLDGAMKALEQVREIWGINAPIQVEGETMLRVGGLPREEAIRRRRAELDESLTAERQATETQANGRKNGDPAK